MRKTASAANMGEAERRRNKLEKGRWLNKKIIRAAMG